MPISSSKCVQCNLHAQSTADLWLSSRLHLTKDSWIKVGGKSLLVHEALVVGQKFGQLSRAHWLLFLKFLGALASDGLFKVSWLKWIFNELVCNVGKSSDQWSNTSLIKKLLKPKSGWWQMIGFYLVAKLALEGLFTNGIISIQFTYFRCLGVL